jgi:hypothetical protein
MPVVADIMVAGHRAPADAEFVQQTGAIGKIGLDRGAVDGDVAGMDHEIGVSCSDPRRKRRPIVGKMPLAGAEMRVRNLDYSHWCFFRRREICASRSPAIRDFVCELTHTRHVKIEYQACGVRVRAASTAGSGHNCARIKIFAPPAGGGGTIT